MTDFVLGAVLYAAMVAGLAAVVLTFGTWAVGVALVVAVLIFHLSRHR